MTGQIVVDGQLPLLLTEPRYLIGRGDGCQILLPEGDGAVSRRHALLERDPQGIWSIVDLGSRNGTLVNGEHLTDRHSLSDGDRISVGKSQIVLALPRSQPTIAVASPTFEESPRANPTIAVEVAAVQAAAIAPPTSLGHENVPVSPPSPPTYSPPVQAAHEPTPTQPVERPSPPAPPASAYEKPQRSYEPSQQSYEPPQQSYEPPRPVYSSPVPQPEPTYTPSPAHSYSEAGARPTGSGAGGMGFVISGVALIAVCLVTYLAYIEPKMTEYQSVGGQLAGGLMSMLGNNSYVQQFQALYYERIACIVGGFIGAGLVLVGVLKRR